MQEDIKTLIDSLDDESLLELYNKIDTQITFLNNNIINIDEDKQEEK